MTPHRAAWFAAGWLAGTAAVVALVEHDDLRVAAFALCGSSWPLDMAQRMEERADRLTHAVNALPALLDENEKLRDEVASLRRWVESPRMTRSEARRA